MRPERRAILDSIHRVREGIDPHRHAPFAQHFMRIPLQDYQAICRLGYNLSAKDPAEKADAWERFEKSPFSEPYRIGKVLRGVTRNGLILPHIKG
jgi:hypothetical protein